MSEGAPDAGRVFVFGSANHDHTLTVEELPRPGQTILAWSYADGFGGKGANQAIAASLAEARVLFVGAVGRDEQGDAIVANLSGHGVDTRWTSRVDDEPTGRAFVLVDAHGGNEIVVAAGANGALTSASIDDALRAVVASDIVVVQCEIPTPCVEQIIRGGARRGALVIVNLAPFTTLPRPVIAQVGLLIVNESEARALVPTVPSSDDLAAAVVDAAGCACVVTLGERGSTYAGLDGRIATVEAVTVADVVDTTGAGDVYVGGLAASLARREDIVDAMRVASAAAARSVSRRGAQDPLHQPAAQAVG